MPWNPFNPKNEPIPADTYDISVHCNNCTWNDVLYIPEGQTAFDWLKTHNVCPHCKCNTLVQA